MLLLLLVGLVLVFTFFSGWKMPSKGIAKELLLQLTSTPTYIPTLSGYFNDRGDYAFNYPSDWQGTEDGSNLQFQLSEGAMIYLYVDDQTTEYGAFKANSELFSVISNEVNTEIGGVSAQCVELSQPESQTVSAIACFIPKNGKGYIISVAELDGLSDADRKIVQGEFMDLLLSFRFTE